MNIKKDIFIVLLLLLFLIIGGVSAADDDSDLSSDAVVEDTIDNAAVAETTIVETDQTEVQAESSIDDPSNLIENDTEELSEGNSETTISNDSPNKASSKSESALGANKLGATLVDLQTLINQNGNTKTLYQDYIVGTNTADYQRVTINKNLVINGNNHIIDANGRGQIFYVTGSRTITFNDLIIRNAGTGQNNGGAFYARNDGCTITFNNCQFINNKVNGDGGAVNFYDRGTFTFTNCNFVENSATGNGGAVYADYQATMTFTNCNFTANTGVTGAAISTSYTSYLAESLTINGCQFTRNAGTGDGVVYFLGNTVNIRNSKFDNNTAYADGGAIHIRSSSNPVYVTNCNFTGNMAQSVEEGSEGRGGALRVSSVATLHVEDCIFDGNSAMYGGGVYAPYAADQSSTFTDSKFYNNRGTSNGGAIYWNANGTTFTNLDFAHNEADTGAGIFFGYGVANEIITNCNFTDNKAMTTGGAIRGIYEPANIQIRNSKFIDNAGPTGGAISMGQGAQTITVTNSNFTGNHADNEGGCIYFEHDGETISVTNSNFDSNYAGSGGAIHLYSNHMADSYTDVQILNCNFTKNNSTATDASYGGSAIGLNWANDVTINNCKFDKNNASANGAILLDYCYDVDITNTNFTDNYAARFGGAFYFYHAINNADVTFQKIVFNNNSAGRSGGAISTSLFSTSYENLGNLYKNWIITDCNFTNNSAVLSAGAAYLPWLVDPNIYAVKFINNTAGTIGALYISGNNLNVHDINFTNNTASTGDAGALSVGQGSTNDFSKFYNMQFVNNSAYGNGGAVAGTASHINLTNMNFTNNKGWYGGGLYWYTGSDVIIDKQNYFNNSANSGGAIDIYNTHRTNITNVNCVNNTANVDAGAIWFNSDYGTVSDCNFTNNTAKAGVAGALYLDSNQQHVYNCNFLNNTAGTNGGAIYDSGRGSDNSNEIKNCTFIDNEAYNGGGAYINDGRVTQINNSTFKDNTASHNGGGAYVLIDNSIAYVDYDLFDHTGVEKNSTEKITRTASGNRNFIVDSYFIDNIDYPISYELLVDGLNGIITVTAPSDATKVRNGKVTYKYSYTNETDSYTRPTQQVPTDGDFEEGVVSFRVYEEHIGTFNVTFGFEEDTYLYKEFNIAFETKDARGDFTILQGYIDAAIANGIYEYNLTRSFTYTLGNDEHGNPLDDGQMYINQTFTINGNGFTINALGVCRIFNVTGANVVFNNVTFANGKTDFTNSKGVYEGTMGGAIYWANGEGKLNDCHFVNNSASADGGALFVDSDSGLITITNGNFTHNRAGLNGGAVDWNASSGDIEKTYFFNNTAKNGGAVFVGHSGEGGKIIDSTFENNTADLQSGHGGAIDWNASHGDVERSYFYNNSAYDGGAIFVGESSSTGLIANSTFINNTATKNGGAVDWNASSGFLENSTFINNTADYGGAVFRGGGSYQGSGYNNTFIGNHARVNGGAVDWNGTGGNIKDSKFINNTADVNGGAVFVGASGTTGILVNSTFINNSAKEHGGAVDWYASSGDLEDSTFINNSAKYGGAVFVGQASATGKIFNSTFINNTAIENGGAVDWNASSGFLENSTFINNSAKFGGAAYRGGGSYNGSSYNNTFIGNHAEIAGGAVDWAGTAGNIRDTVFINNTAGSEGVDGFGGAVFIGNNGTNGSLVNLTFINNSATRNGGAIDWNSSGGALNDSYLEGNTAVYGGAVFVGGNSSTGLIYNTTFINNNASENGGAIDWNASSGFLENSTFINNSAKFGGAAYRGGGSYNGSSYNNTFIGNHAQIAGGAVDWASTGGNIRDSRFINNTAGDENTDGYGGAVFIGAVTTDDNVVNGTIYNVTFINNSATLHGGAIGWNSSGGLLNLSYFENNTAKNGGAVFVGTNSSTSVVYNTTFIHNIATRNGGAVHWNASSGFVEWSTFLNNSADNGGALYRGGGSNDGSSYNNTFMYNHANYNGGAVDWVSTGGNIRDSVFMYNTAGNEASEGVTATDGNGGAVFIGAEGSTGQIINTTFIGNNATLNGGAIDWNATSGYLENSTFTDNHAYDGGALYRGGSAETGSGYHNNFTHNIAEHNGGAIYWASSSIKIVNYTFTDNIAGVDGGAIYAGTTGEGGSVVNSTFTGNNATTGNGGAIDWAASQGTVENSSFDTNFGKQGGAIHIGANSDEGKILNSNFTNNIATLHGGAVDWNGASGNVSGSYFEDNTAPKGGAISIDENAEEMTVTDSTFKSNDASEDGGAIYVSQVKNVSVNASSFDSNNADHAGAIFVDNCENFTIDRSNFTANTAVNDGAVHWSGKEGTIKNSVFTNNTATEQGGAVGWKGEEGTISNSTFTNNSAADAGGAIVWYGDNTDSIHNSTFESNRAYKGGAIYWIDGDGGIVYNSTFKTNVGYEEGGAIMVYNNTNHYIVNNTFTGNQAPGYFNPEGIQYGTGGAIYTELVDSITIENNTFSGNLAALDGGAIALDDTNNSKINHNNITGSSANENGGSIQWVNSKGILINDTKIENSASHDLGGAIYIKDASGNIENITIDGSTARYDAAGAIYVDGQIVLNHTSLSNFNSLNDIASGILFDGGESYLDESTLTGKNAVVVSAGAKAHLTKNTITGEGDYAVLNNGNLWLDTNTFQNVIINNGTIETQTYTVILENSTVVVVSGNDAILNATIEDDNKNKIVVINDLFHMEPEDGAAFDLPSTYVGTVNYGTYANAQRGIYVVNANEAGLKKNDVKTGVLIVKGKTDIALDVQQINEGETVTITATPYPNDGIEFLGNVTFTINGQVKTPVNITGGKATLTLTDVPAGTYQVNAFYSGDVSHTNATNDTIFIVNKHPVEIDVIVNTIVYGQNATAIANVSNNANGTVIFLLNGRKEVPLDANHRAVWENISGLVPGNYTITAVYPGNEYFEMAYKEYTFEVVKANSTISAVANPTSVEYRQEQYINIQLNTSATGTVKVTINDIEYFADVTTGGKAVVNVTGLPIGQYERIAVVYSGDDYFNANSTTVEFEVTMIVNKISNYDFNITTQDINYGENEQIEVRLPQDATGTVKVLVDGVEVGNKTIGLDNLIFVVNKPYADNKHNVTVIYSGNDIYTDKTNNTASFKVSPIDPTVSVNVQNINYRQSETIEVVLPSDITGNVTIKLNGKVYAEELPISEGKVTLTIPSDGASFLEVNTYEVTAVFNGDRNYNTKEATNTFTVSKIASDISVSGTNINYKENEDISLTLTVLNASGKVNITIVNITTGRAVKSEIVDMTTGTKAITYTDAFDAGSYRIDVEYYNDKNYLNSTASSNFVISQVQADLNETSPDIVYGADEQITVNITAGASGTIYIIVNGTYYDPVTISNNQAVFTITKPNAGEYKFTAYYSGDNNYLPKNINGAFNVAKDNVSVDASYSFTSDVYGVDEVITVTLNNTDATGTVVVKVDGVEIANKTIGVDDLIFTITKPSADPKHNVSIIYSGDINFNGKEANGTFEVREKEPDAMTVTVNNIIYGDDEIVEVYVADDANGQVKITLDGVDIETKDLVGGRVTFNLSDLNAKDGYELVAHFISAGNYTNKDMTAKFNVSKAQSHINVTAYDIREGDTETIDVILLDKNANGKVTITIKDSNGQIVKGPDEHAFVTTTEAGVQYDFTGLPLGKYNVTVAYSDDANYNDSSAIYEFVVSFISVEPTDISYKEQEIISVIAPNDATGNVTITISTIDANYTITKNLNEAVIDGNKANLTFTLDYDTYPFNAGRYIVFANYTGDSSYESVEVKAPFLVSKASSSVAVDSATIVYGEDELINVTVKGVNNEVITQGFVTITLNGTEVSISQPVDANGVARFNVTNLIVGDYTVNATFNGNENYNASSSLDTFSVTKADVLHMLVEAIDITYGNDENITVRVDDFNASGTVYLVIYNGEDIVKTTEKQSLENGVTVFHISDLAISDNYKVTAFYGDDNNYKDMDANDTFKVERAAPDITVSPVNITYGNVETIKITIPNRNATGNITITVAGITKSVNVTGGEAEITFEGLEVANYDTMAYYRYDPNYLDVDIPVYFVVSKAIPSSIVIAPQNVTYGVDEVITVTVNPVENGAIPSGTVTITVDVGTGTITKTESLTNGVASFNLGKLDANNYRVFAVYNGDDANGRYESISANAPFHINKTVPALDIKVSNITYGEDELINITVNGIEDGSTPTLFVTITINGTSIDISKQVDANGIARFNVTGLEAGNYKVNATYSGDGNYNSTSNTAEFTVNKSDVTISIDVNNTVYGQEQTITVNVDGEVTEGSVSIKLNGVDYGTATVTDGKATFTIQGDDKPFLEVANDYEITAVFTSADPNYEDKETSAKFNVTKAQSSISIIAENIEYLAIENVTVIMTDYNASGRLVVAIKDAATGELIDSIVINRFTTTTADGEKYPFEGLAAGNYTAVASYSGDRNYIDKDVSMNFEVSLIDVELSEDSPDITYGNNETIKVTIDGGAIGTIKVMVDGVQVGEIITITTATEEDKVFEFNVEKPAVDPRHNVTVIFTGNANHNDKTIEGFFAVSENSTFEIEEDSPDIVYSENEVITISLPNDATGTVYLVVNGTYYTPIGIDSNHQAVFTITAPLAGDYEFTAFYSGDANYAAKNISGAFTVEKNNVTLAENHELSIVYGNDETITVTITGIEGALSPTGTITVSVDGTEVDTITIGNDLVFTVAKPAADPAHNITVVYSGDNNYNDKTINGTFKVTKNATLDLSEVSPDIDYGADEVITVTVSGDATGTIIVKVKGTQVGETIQLAAVTEEDKEFEITVAKPDGGEYTVEVIYSGDDNYDARTIEGGFTVSPIAPEITEDSPDITYGADETITITVPEGASGTLDVTITNDAGVRNIRLIIGEDDLTITMEKPDAGTYNINIEYSGCANYTAASVTGEFTVSQAEVDLSEVSPDITYGENETITVTITGDATGTITVSVDGTQVGEAITITEATVDDKVFEFTLEKPGVDSRHNITVVYSGDGNYMTKTIEGVFAVSENNTFEMTEDSPDIVYSENEVITITLPNDATGTVYLVVNGTYYTPIGLDENHQAVFTITAPLGGDYEFTAYYSGDANYAAKDISGAFTVEKNNVTLEESHAISIVYGNDETITVTITGIEGALSPTGTITVSVDGTEVDTITIGNDLVFTVAKPAADPAHNITVVYSGDNNYNDKTINGTFEVTKNATLDLSEVSPDIDYGADEIITVTISGDATGTIIVKVNGEKVGETIELVAVSEEDKEFNVTVAKPDGGEYTVEVIYSGDDNYDGKTITGEFTVSPVAPEITENSPDITYGANETITITVPEGASGTLDVTITGEDGVREISLVIGVDDLSITLDKPVAGKYDISIKYSGCDNYTAATVTGEFTVSPATAIVAVENITIKYGETAVVNITVTDGEGNLISGTAIITVDGTDKEVTVTDGVAQAEFGGLDVDHYVSNVVFTNDNYETVTESGTVVVTKATNATLEVVGGDYVYGTPAKVTVKVTGNDGELLSGTVIVNVNNVNYAVILNNGEGELTINGLSSAIYDINAKYLGDDSYAPVENNTEKLNITSSNIAIIEVEAENVIFGENVTATISLYDSEGVLLNGIVQVKVDDGQWIDVEVKDGVGVYNFTGLTVGTHTIVAQYDNDSYVGSPITDQVDVEVSLIDSASVIVENITIKYGEDAVVNITVVDEDGTLLNGNANITVNGVTKEVQVTDGKAEASFTDLEAGSYQVIAVFANSNYAPATGYGTVNVTKATNATLEVTGGDYVYGNPAKVTVKVTGNDGELLNGTVIVTVNEVNYAVSLNDGEGELTINGLSSGIYDINAKYLGDDNYAPVENNTEKLNITSSDIAIIEVEAQDVIFGENVTATISLYDSEGVLLNGIVQVKVDDGQWIDVEVKDGVGEYNFTGLAVGTHTIVAQYDNDSYVGSPITDQVDVEVSLIDSASVIVENITIKYGEDAVVNITVVNVDGTLLSGTANITVNGETKEVEVTDGKAEASFSNLEARLYPVTVVFENDNFAPTTGYGIVNVTKATNATLEVVGGEYAYGEAAVITVSLTDGDSKLSGIVVVNVNGVDYAVKVTDGEGSLSINGLPSGTYPITAEFLGNDNYGPITNDEASLVINASTSAEIDASVKDITYGETAEVIGTVVDGEGKAITGTVLITIDDGEAVEVEVTDGVFEYPIEGLTVGTYSITIEAVDYDAEAVELTLNVNKAKAEIIAENTNDPELGEDAIINIGLVDNEGNPITGTVIVSVDGEEGETVVIDAESVDDYISGLGVGSHTVVIALDDDNYEADDVVLMVEIAKASSDTVTITVNPSKEGYVYGEDAVLNIRVTGLDDAPIDGVVVVTVDGVDYGVTLVDGEGQLTIPGLDVAEYPVIAVFAGNDQYESATNDEARIIVFKAQASLTGETDDVTYGEDVILKINLTGNGESIVDKVTVHIYDSEGQEVDAIPHDLAEGDTIAISGLAAGDYKFIISFGGNDQFNPVDSEEIPFTVSPADIEISINPESDYIVYGDEIPIIINITGVDEPVDVLINVTDSEGNLIIENAPLTVDGSGTYVIPDGNKVGNYTVSVVAIAANNFNEAQAEANITIHKAKAIIVSEIESTIYGAAPVIDISDIIGVYGESLTGRVTVGYYDNDGESEDGIYRCIYGDAVDGKLTLETQRFAAGQHTLYLSFENENYESDLFAVTAVVEKAVPDLTATVKNITVGDNASIKIELRGYLGESINENVTVLINGEPYTTIVCEKGVNVTVVEGLDVGNYTVTLVYGGNENYTGTQYSTPFNVAKYDSSEVKLIVSVGESEYKYGQAATVNVNLTGVDGEALSGLVIVTVNDVDYAVNVADGVGSIDINGLDVGKYPVVAKFVGNDKYGPADSNKNAVIKVVRYDNVDLVIEGGEYDYGSPAIVNISLSADGAPIDGQVVVTVNKVNYTVNVLNGKGSLEINGLPSGEYPVNARFVGDNNFAPARASDSLVIMGSNVATIDAEIDNIVYGETANLTIEVKDSEGKGINTTVSVVVDDGEAIEVEVVNGKAVLPIEDLDAGEHNITVSLADESYEAEPDETSVYVEPGIADVTVTLNDPEYGENATVTIDAKDKDGKPINGTAKVTVGDKEYTVDVVDGKAVVDAGILDAGDYPVTVEFTKDNYQPVVKADTLTISKKDNAIVTVSGQNIREKDIESIQVTLTDADGNKLDGIVILTIGDTNYSANVTGGKATVNIKNLEAGNYTVEAVFIGNDNYEPASNSTKITVIPYVEAVINIIPDQSSVNITLTDADGKPITGKVNVTIDNETQEVQVINGKAKVPAVEGIREVTVSYPGDEKYAPANATKTVVVLKDSVPTEITITVSNITYSQVAKIDLTLKDQNGLPVDGVITVTVDEVPHNVTITKGRGSISIPNLNAGNYTVVANYSGANGYDPSFASKDFNVRKIKTYFVFQNMTTTSVETSIEGRIGEYFNATLYDEFGNVLANRKVQIGFNGKIYNKTTNATGGFRLQVNLRHSANYTFALYHLEDDNYDAAFSVARIQVLKQVPKFTVTAPSYKASAKTKTITAKVISIFGSPVQYRTVSFIVDGKYYSAKTNADGIAKVKVSLTKKGTYKVTAKFEGDGGYKPITKQLTIKIT